MKVGLGQASKAMEQFGSVASTGIGLVSRAMETVSNVIGCVVEVSSIWQRHAAAGGCWPWPGRQGSQLSPLSKRRWILASNRPCAGGVRRICWLRSSSSAEGDEYRVWCSKISSFESASALGSMFKGVRLLQENAAEAIDPFHELATDLASLVHIPVQEAMKRSRAG